MNIKEMPLEMMRAILQWLPILDQLSAAEAAEEFEVATELQIERTPLFIIKPKKVLVLAINNMESTGTVLQALKTSVYKEVNLVIARSLTETRDSAQVRKIVKWLENVTMNGQYPFFAIELVGNVRMCGCR
jgi:hypothetical protein